MDEIKVSVICLAYNHAKYIRDALEGFVSQKTGFPFEVIVHDDASTDGTDGIIREYQARYPDIIRPVFQKVNQYSRGISITPAFIFPLIRGRFVALCEGDDYWTDHKKLQKQVEALEAHPEADLCTHKTLRLKNGRFDGWIAPRLGTGIVPADKVILGGGGWFCATSSFLCRREAYLEWTPVREVIVIDYTLAIQCSVRGGMVYLKDPMSAYRVGTEGSWTKRHDRKARIKNRLVMIQMLDVLDKWTEGRFSRAIRIRREMFRSDLLLLNKDYLGLYSPARSGINLIRLRHSFQKVIRRWF
ncbi:MAG: glycosyltransferase [Bacteroidales bacterium]|nr:glycosyltransferase [Bacteroidales bacterium]